MNKAVSAGIGVGIGLIALAFIILSPGGDENLQDESMMQVQLSDEIGVETEESKSFEVQISEGVKVGDVPPDVLILCFRIFKNFKQ